MRELLWRVILKNSYDVDVSQHSYESAGLARTAAEQNLRNGGEAVAAIVEPLPTILLGEFPAAAVGTGGAPSKLAAENYRFRLELCNLGHVHETCLDHPKHLEEGRSGRQQEQEQLVDRLIAEFSSSGD